MNWDNYTCGICGGEAGMALMSLVARCYDCGAWSTELTKNHKPAGWQMPCAEGAD